MELEFLRTEVDKLKEMVGVINCVVSKYCRKNQIKLQSTSLILQKKMNILRTYPKSLTITKLKVPEPQ